MKLGVDLGGRWKVRGYWIVHDFPNGQGGRELLPEPAGLFCFISLLTLSSQAPLCPHYPFPLLCFWNCHHINSITLINGLFLLTMNNARVTK